MPNRLCWYRPCCTIPDVHLHCLFSAEDTHSPGLNLVPDSTKTTAYVLCAIVFQETSVRHSESENSVCPPSPILPSFFRRLTTPVARSSLFLFKELYQSHFTPGLCFSNRWQLLATLRANSKRYRLPLFLSLSSTLSCPDLPLSSRSIPLQETKRMIEMPRVDRPSSLIALLFFDLRAKKICMRILME